MGTSDLILLLGLKRGRARLGERHLTNRLITNLDQDYSPCEVLKQYKAQSKVETSFKFLKDPLFVGPVFLKKPSRVEALAYVLLMALLMYGLLERRVREAMTFETEPLLIPSKVKTSAPRATRFSRAWSGSW